MPRDKLRKRHAKTFAADATAAEALNKRTNTISGEDGFSKPKVALGRGVVVPEQSLKADGAHPFGGMPGGIVATNVIYGGNDP